MLLLAVAHAASTPLPVVPILHTPLPVNVKAWPSPDAVATKTLQVATWTLAASAVAVVAGVVGIFVAMVDARNSTKQLNLLLDDRKKVPEIELVADVANSSTSNRTAS